MAPENSWIAELREAFNRGEEIEVRVKEKILALQKRDRELIPMETINSPFSLGEYKQRAKQIAHPYKAMALCPFTIYMAMAIISFSFITGHYFFIPFTFLTLVLSILVGGPIIKRMASKSYKGIREEIALKIELFNKKVDFFNFMLVGHIRGYIEKEKISQLRKKLEKERDDLIKKTEFYQWFEKKPQNTPYSEDFGNAEDCADLEDLEEKILEIKDFNGNALSLEIKKEAEEETKKLLKGK
ncbi:MAG: hypothetical protein WC459_00725 [Patescibacteria group bacterium]